ncbi:MAG: response regulator [Burkholderiaceae bacterium]
MNPIQVVLLSTDSASDAELLGSLVKAEFKSARVLAQPEEFERIDGEKHLVLVFGHRSLEDAEHAYLRLYRTSALIGALRHRTILLCAREDVRHAYDLCRRGTFDDYVMFWPLSPDARLPMSMHLAFKALSQGGTADAQRRTADEAVAREPAGDEAVRPIVMVVDDDDFQRRMLGRMLSAADLEVVQAGSGMEALAILRRLRPDLILMDVRIPDIDGIELTRRLKSGSEHRDVPIVMITGQSERKVIVDSREAGADDFVVKPVERDVLLKKVLRYVAG